jgi:hypothetical protein
MLRYLFDTDHLTLFEHGHPPVARRLMSHPADAVGISVVTDFDDSEGLAPQEGKSLMISRARCHPRPVPRQFHGSTSIVSPLSTS